MRWHVSVKLDALASFSKIGIMTGMASPITLRAWTALLRAQSSALSQVEHRLKDAGFPPLAWYDVLLELDRAGEKGMRPFELERALLLPQYGLSRLLTRIAAAGYLERRPCADDGRGQTLVITTVGRDLRHRMWPVYGSAVEAAFGGRLSEGEAARLRELLDRLA